MSDDFLTSKLKSSLEVIGDVKDGEKLIAYDGAFTGRSASTIGRFMYNTLWGGANRQDVADTLKKLVEEVSNVVFQLSKDLSAPHVMKNFRTYNTMTAKNRKFLDAIKDLYSRVIPRLERCIQLLNVMYGKIALLDPIGQSLETMKKTCSEYTQ